MITKASIQSLISNNQLVKAIDQLIEGLSDDDKNDAILLKSRLTSLDRSVNIGTISHSQSSVSRNQITNAILSLADKLGGDIPSSSGGSRPNIQQTHFGSGDNLSLIHISEPTRPY